MSALISGMSLAEIKDAMRRLTPAELADIEQLVVDLRDTSKAEPRTRIAHPSDPDVPAAMKAVFEKHREVLHRLAQ